MLSRTLIFLAAMVAAISGDRAISAEPAIVDGFEAGTVPWKTTNEEGPAVVNRLRLDANAARHGKSGVLIETTTSDVGLVNLDYEIGRAPVIGEFSAGVWIRGDRAGVQLTARVVLPRSVDPSNGLPVKFVAYGDDYRDIGRWQRLTIDGLVLKTTRRARKLRLQFGPTLDERGAYVDRLAVRIRPGRCSATFAIDDLIGYWPPRITFTSCLRRRQCMARLQDRSIGRHSRSRSSGTPQLQGRAFAIRITRQPSCVGHPIATSHVARNDSPGRWTAILPRIFEQAGEPFTAIRQLGFNAVAIAQVATVEQLSAARQAGLWVVCPPPTIDQIEAGGLANGWENVFAWHLGTTLTGTRPTDHREVVNRAVAETIRPRDVRSLAR